MSVKEIETHLLQTYGWKNESGLKKADLEMLIRSLPNPQLLNQTFFLRSANEEKETNNLSLSDRSYPEQIHPLEHLKEKGWFVWTVLSPSEVEETKRSFLNWRDRNGLNIDRNGTSKGIFHSYPGLAQEEFLWKVRENLKVREVFAGLFGVSPQDLLTSMDVGCIQKPLSERNQKPLSSTGQQWWHVDQGRFAPHPSLPCSYQGVLALTDQGIGDGGSCLVEGSHLSLNDYYQSYPFEGYGKNIHKVSPLRFNLPRIKVCLKAGQILVFDSRTIHCNVPPSPGHSERISIYVSMLPRAFCSPQDLERRRQVYLSGSATNHWAYGPYLNDKPSKPNFFYNPHLKPLVENMSFQKAELTPLRQSLIG